VNFSADQAGRPCLNRLCDCYAPGQTCQSSAFLFYFTNCNSQMYRTTTTGHLSLSRPPVSFQLENLNRPSAFSLFAEHSQVFCPLSLSHTHSLFHPLFNVGQSIYIDRYFQYLGPQDITLGNFQGTDRPTFTP